MQENEISPSQFTLVMSGFISVFAIVIVTFDSEFKSAPTLSLNVRSEIGKLGLFGQILTL